MLSKSLEIGFTLLLVVMVPALSLATTRQAEIRALPRLAIYSSAVLSEWLVTAIGGAVVMVASTKLSVAGFEVCSLAAFAGWAAGLAGLSLAGLGAVLMAERRGWLQEESELVRLLMPATLKEKLWAALLVAPTAGFCEEFLYRGFLLSLLSQWCHSVGWGWVLSSVVFGFAHTYQGVSGMIRVMLMGVLLAYPAVHLGSLYPSMAAHFLIDAVALVWLGPRFLRQRD
jgi:membrane protease YdiL (CAAX protease family)